MKVPLDWPILLGLAILNIRGCNCDCHTLPRRQGIEIECRNLTSPIDCYSCSQAPTGSIATYKCEERYLIGKGITWSPKWEIKCLKNGFWEGFDKWTNFFCEAECGAVQGSVQGLIFGGQVTIPSMWPWHAAIFRPGVHRKPIFICGGTLVETVKGGLVILTAAHCLKDGRDNLKVVLGADTSLFEVLEPEMKGDIYDVLQVVQHQNYSESNSFAYDVAIFYLNGSIRLSSKVIPACLDSVDDWEQHQVNLGETGQLVGFGSYNASDILNPSKKLKLTNVSIVSSGNCVAFNFRDLYTQSELCGGYVTGQERSGPCLGDSGGGLVFIQTEQETSSQKYFVQAIVSHGPSICDDHSVYTRVSAHLKWIHGIEFDGNQPLQFSECYSSVGSIMQSDNNKCNPDVILDMKVETTKRPTNVAAKKYIPLPNLECGIAKLQLPMAGTELTNSASWPWNAAIFRTTDDGSVKFMCGGTLIETLNQGFLILTTASCLKDGNELKLKVALGARCRDYQIESRNPNNIYNVKHYRRHESYSLMRAFENDIAVLQLDRPICVSDNVVPACLSSRSATTNEIDINTVGDIVGYGHCNLDTVSAPARRLQVKVISHGACNIWRDMFILRSTEICTESTQENSRTCVGDGGAGLLMPQKVSKTSNKYFLQGIVSHGPYKANGNSCGKHSVLTKVGSFISWIKNIQFPDDGHQSPESWLVCNYTSPQKVEPPTQLTTLRPILTSTWSTSKYIPTTPATFSDIQFETLWYHNYYRNHYGVSTLRLNAELNQAAEYYADLCLKNQNFPLLGRNVFELKESNGFRYKNSSEIIRQAIEYWCNQGNHFPGPSPFAQIIWKLTTNIGVAVKSIEGTNWKRTVVVVTYFPVCNIWTTTSNPNIGYSYQESRAEAKPSRTNY